MITNRVAGPKPPPVSRLDLILDFMHAECDFNVEHADGSFLDHLNFCRDYSALHYPEVSRAFFGSVVFSAKF